MTSIDRNSAIVFVAAIVVRGLFHYLTGYTADDAFITFRYAENILTGEGFVYNLGEHVLGTTTPLFTLVLVLFGLIGMEVTRAALMISLLCSGSTALIVYRLAVSLRFTCWAFVPVVLYIFFPRLLPTDTGGMETALFTLLVTAAFYYQRKRQGVYALAMATLASVTRPEGFLSLGILLVYNCFKYRKRIKQFLLVPLPIIVPWVAFATWYFGSPIPNSVPAKMALYSQFGTMSPLENLGLIVGWPSLLALPLLSMVIMGGWWLWQKQDFGKLEIVWLLMFILALTFSSTHIFHWYVSPIYPIYLLFAGAVFPLIGERVKIARVRTPVIAGAIVIVLSLGLVVANAGPVLHFYGAQWDMENVHKRIGLYLRAYANENDLVAAEDIGYMGYYSGRKILDRDGLVSPEATPYNRSAQYLELILDHQPDWVVATPRSEISRFLDDSTFVTQYEHVKTFGRGEEFIEVKSPEYRLYSRRTEAPHPPESVP